MWYDDPPTEKQLNIIAKAEAKYKVKFNIENKGKASQFLDNYIKNGWSLEIRGGVVVGTNIEVMDESIAPVSQLPTIPIYTVPTKTGLSNNVIYVDGNVYEVYPFYDAVFDEDPILYQVDRMTEFYYEIAKYF